jgi:hypothetical protein
MRLPSQHLVINSNKWQASRKETERQTLGGDDLQRELPAYKFKYLEEEEEEEEGRRRRLRKGQSPVFYNLQCVMRSRTVKWTTHVLRMDRSVEHTEAWYKNVKGKSPLGRCKRRWEDSS